MGFISNFLIIFLLILTVSLKYTLAIDESNANIAAVDRPNAFVTFRVNDPQIRQNVQRIQKELNNRAPEFLPSFQSPQSLHLTLIIVHLNESNFERAKLALRSAIRKFVAEQQPWDPLNVSFQGLSNFGQQTLFAALERQSSMRIVQLYDFVKNEFNRHGIPSLSKFPTFHPHMSLVNLLAEQQQWLSRYWPSLELEWEQRLLGIQQVNALEICDINLNATSMDYDVLYKMNLIE